MNHSHTNMATTGSSGLLPVLRFSDSKQKRKILTFSCLRFEGLRKTKVKKEAIQVKRSVSLKRGTTTKSPEEDLCGGGTPSSDINHYYCKYYRFKRENISSQACETWFCFRTASAFGFFKKKDK